MYTIIYVQGFYMMVRTGIYEYVLVGNCIMYMGQIIYVQGFYMMVRTGIYG